MKRIFSMAWLLAGLLSVVPAYAGEDAEVLVRDTSDRMLAALQAEHETLSAHPERIYDLVSEIVLPHFDFERISRWVLGKYWRQATSAQRTRFTEEFRVLLVRTYATALNEYNDQVITYLPSTPGSSPGEVTVRTEVEQPGGFPIPINYDLYSKDGEWKVYDVIIDGVSLVTNYRTSFASEIRQGGLDKLIDTLAARNKQATG